MTLTLAERLQVVEAALDNACERSSRVRVCICDENGRFVTPNRTAGAVATMNWQAIGKDLASASTGQLGDYMPSRGEACERFSTVTGEGKPLSHRQSGLPIYRDGTLVRVYGIRG